MFEKLADLAELEPQGQKDLSPWFEPKLVRRTWPVNFVFARSLCLLGQYGMKLKAFLWTELRKASSSNFNFLLACRLAADLWLYVWR